MPKKNITAENYLKINGITMFFYGEKLQDKDKISTTLLPGAALDLISFPKTLAKFKNEISPISTQLKSSK